MGDMVLDSSIHVQRRQGILMSTGDHEGGLSRCSPARCGDIVERSRFWSPGDSPASIERCDVVSIGMHPPKACIPTLPLQAQAGSVIGGDCCRQLQVTQIPCTSTIKSQQEKAGLAGFMI